ncbi:type I-E CRISPR-associated protein Cas6/Cse3/CasE [soil metagenome]|nr:type I-E CRISPR-associated protein Cas6/Cse3/CasE [Gemmatimonadota bacterium]
MSAPTLSRALLRLRPARGWTAEYITHQLVADLFGDRDDRCYLYRTTRERPGGVEVLVLSGAEPLPPHQLPVRDWGAALNVQSKPFAPALSAGQLLDFEIRVNATRVVTGPDRKPNGELKKRRHDVWELVWQADKENFEHTPHRTYSEWLAGQLEGAAELVSPGGVRGEVDGEPLARVTERGEVRARRGDRREAIRFVAANLIGTLRVLDPDRFLELVTRGIGREKAFGCGLLCLSRPGTVLPRAYPDAAKELY